MLPKDVAHDWAIAELARLCDVSRSTFAGRFRRIVGVSPIEYLSDWRIAMTCGMENAALARWRRESAFNARLFSRAVGQSPKAFATGHPGRVADTFNPAG